MRMQQPDNPTTDGVRRNRTTATCSFFGCCLACRVFFSRLMQRLEFLLHDRDCQIWTYQHQHRQQEKYSEAKGWVYTPSLEMYPVFIQPSGNRGMIFW